MQDIRGRVARFSVYLLTTVVVALPCVSITSGAAADPPKSPASSIVLTPCKLPGVADTARCGVLDVPENPNRPRGRRLQIGVAVIPATGEAQTDPLVPLMGGSWRRGNCRGGVLRRTVCPLRKDHDILLVDQRGTGRSNALHCDLYKPDDPAVSLRDLFPPSAVEGCGSS